MAKKKVTRQSKEPKQMPTQPQDFVNHEQSNSSMDDPAEMLQSLKSLNERLVKETVERRKEVDSLIQVKEAMEVDLTQNRSEKEKLVGELTEASEVVLGLKLEKTVVCAFVRTRLDEMGVEFCGLMEEKAESERVNREKEVEIGLLKDEMTELIQSLEKERDLLSRVCSERDVIKIALDGLLKEASELRGKVSEMENERMALEEVENWRVQCEKLIAEKTEIEIAKGTLLKEKESVKRMLDESVGVIEDLKSKMDQTVKEIIEIDKEKNGLEMKIEKLEKEVAQLNEKAFSFSQEKKESAERISDLEKRIGEAMEKDNAMRMEIDNLATQLQKKEKDIGILTQQRDSLQLKLNLVQEESKNLLHKIEIITEEKIDMEAAKVEAESIIVDLLRESSELKDDIASLTELSKVEKEKNEELLSEISQLGHALHRVSLERDDALKCFSDDRKRAENLSLLLSDKEKKIGEAMDELKRMKISQEDSLNINKEMERRIEILVKERDSMEQNLLEAQCKIDDLRDEMKSLVTNSEKALTLLKNTSLVVCDNHGKGEVESFEHKLAEEFQPFVEQLDAIKTSFINKEKKVEEMKQLLEVALAKEREKKSFFTMLTAATTILAAVSAVYVSRGR